MGSRPSNHPKGPSGPPDECLSAGSGALPDVRSVGPGQVPPELTGKNGTLHRKMGSNPQLGWFIRQNPISMDDLRVALFQETPK